jgi:hypothetical protein
MSDSAGSICDRRRAADCAEPNGSSDDTDHNDAGAATGSIYRTECSAHDESISFPGSTRRRDAATDPLDGADFIADACCAGYGRRDSVQRIGVF